MIAPKFPKLALPTRIIYLNIMNMIRERRRRRKKKIAMSRIIAGVRAIALLKKLDQRREPLVDL